MNNELLDLIAHYGDARENGDAKAGELYDKLRDALALAMPPADNLTGRKTREIMAGSGSYTLTGYVLRANDGKACVISRSAVRWMDRVEFDTMMHPQPDYSWIAIKKPCRYPLCQSDAEQTRIADQVFAELYSGLIVAPAEKSAAPTDPQAVCGCTGRATSGERNSV